MPALAELQGAVRTAVVGGDLSGVASLLTGGGRPERRLAIHQRHYSTSLITSLLNRFPATVWLVGSELVTQAATGFVQGHPPSRPCIAEYGESFPGALATHPGAARLPYLEQFATLEWHLGRLALAVDEPAIDDLPGIAPEAIGHWTVVVQPGVEYLHVDWSLDELIGFFLADTEPEQYALTAGDVWLELRGVRGELRFTRLPAADYAFRSALASGASVRDAVLAGISRDAAFDAGRTLTTFLADGLVTAVRADGSKETRR